MFYHNETAISCARTSLQNFISFSCFLQAQSALSLLRTLPVGFAPHSSMQVLPKFWKVLFAVFVCAQLPWNWIFKPIPLLVQSLCCSQRRRPGSGLSSQVHDVCVEVQENVIGPPHPPKKHQHARGPFTGVDRHGSFSDVPFPRLLIFAFTGLTCVWAQSQRCRKERLSRRRTGLGHAEYGVQLGEKTYVGHVGLRLV